MLAAEPPGGEAGDPGPPGQAGGAGGNGRGALPLPHAARVVEFARERPRVEVQLCVQGQQPSPAEALAAG